jgi:DNA-binding transcriptional LysR family regulator
LHLLRTFSAVARFGSISRAAEALDVTQGAVSKQVQELERWIDVPLFERHRKRLAITPAGARYDRAVRALLAQLEAATLELITSGDGGGALHLSALPTFGARWLIPRLPDFQRRHPQVALHFVPYVHGYDFERPDLDCSILFGDGHWPGARAHYLAGRDVALIVPPASAGLPAVRAPAEVARHALLQHVSVPLAWAQWCEAHGVAGVDPMAGPQFDQFHTMIRAVMAGMGAALVPRCLVQEEIAAGQVEAPAGMAHRSALGYWFCYPEAREHLATLGAFKDWLLARAAETGAEEGGAPDAPGPSHDPAAPSASRAS